MDGGNVGISFCDGVLRLQKRGHWITPSSEAQYSKLTAWLEPRRAALAGLLGEACVDVEFASPQNLRATGFPQPPAQPPRLQAAAASSTANGCRLRTPWATTCFPTGSWPLTSTTRRPVGSSPGGKHGNLIGDAQCVIKPAGVARDELLAWRRRQKRNELLLGAGMGADVRVNPVGKLKRRGAARQRDEMSFGGKNVDRVGK